jgi:hypothetical protein
VRFLLVILDLWVAVMVAALGVAVTVAAVAEAVIEAEAEAEMAAEMAAKAANAGWRMLKTGTVYTPSKARGRYRPVQSKLDPSQRYRPILTGTGQFGAKEAARACRKQWERYRRLCTGRYKQN